MTMFQITATGPRLEKMRASKKPGEKAAWKADVSQSRLVSADVSFLVNRRAKHVHKRTGRNSPNRSRGKP